MKKIFVSQSLVEVETLKGRLEQTGIRCLVKNQQGSTLAGEVPFAEVFPELWIVKDEDEDRSIELLNAWTNVERQSLSTWTCSGCGEKHSSEFTACWKCGREKGSKSKPKQEFLTENDRFPPFLWHNAMSVFLGAAITLVALYLWDYLSLKDASEDRNADGKTDVIYSYSGATLREAKFDDDFNGFFETSYTYNRQGVITRGEIDRNEDGKPDLIEDFTLGKLVSVDFIDPITGKVRKRAFYKFDAKTREEIDEDGDGKFERTVHFDEFESPISSK